MDIYEDYEGNPYSHASPFARILESSPKICTKLIQIGIRSTTHHQRVDQAQRLVEMDDVSALLWHVAELLLISSPILRYGVEVMDMRSLTTSSDTLNRINDILPPDYPVYLRLGIVMGNVIYVSMYLGVTISITLFLTLLPFFTLLYLLYLQLLQYHVALIWMLWTLVLYLE